MNLAENSSDENTMLMIGKSTGCLVVVIPLSDPKIVGSNPVMDHLIFLFKKICTTPELSNGK